MRVPGQFAVAGGLLLVAQVVLGGMRTPLSETRFVFVFLGAAAVCFAIAIVWAFVKGPAAVRLAAVLLFVCLGALAVAIQGVPGDSSIDLMLALSAACGVLAVTLGVRAYLAESVTSRELAAASARAETRVTRS